MRLEKMLVQVQLTTDGFRRKCELSHRIRDAIRPLLSTSVGQKATHPLEEPPFVVACFDLASFNAYGYSLHHSSLNISADRKHRKRQLALLKL